MSVGLSEVGEKSAFRCSSVCRSGLSARFRVCAACMRASVVRFHFSFWGSVCCLGGKGGGEGRRRGVEVRGGGPTRAGTFSLILSLKYFKLLLQLISSSGTSAGNPYRGFINCFSPFLYHFKREIKGLIDGSGAGTAGRRIARNESINRIRIIDSDSPIDHRCRGPQRTWSGPR